MSRAATALGAVLSTAALAMPAATAAAAPAPLGHACTVLQPSGVRYCPTPAPTSSSDQRARSWDGTPLQVDVTLPPSGDGPWPTIVMLPGYGGSDGVSWEEFGGASGSNAGNHMSNVWFATHGYAVVTMNFRGVGYSCGPPYAASAQADAARVPDPACDGVQFEFADQRYDARDVQWVLGVLVDGGIAEPDALGVMGESLGSLVTLELALLADRVRLLDGSFAPWRSPAGTRLHLGATFPIWAIGDLLDGIAPNGRFLSFRPRTATSDDDPLGAIKLTVPMAIAAEAPISVQWVPSSPDSFNLVGDIVFSELAAPDGPHMAALANQIRDYHQAVGMPVGKHVAPILMQDGWSDMLVGGATQALRIADYLKVVAPKAKVALQLADAGHPLAGNKAADLLALDDQATAFFDHYLRGAPGGPEPGSVTAYTATCPASAPSAGPYVGQGMAALAPGAVRFSSAAAQTVLGGGDPSIGAQLDPIVNTGRGAQDSTFDPQCQTFSAVDWPGTGVYTQPVTKTFTLLGLPTIRMHVATTGDDGQLHARLWDVAPDGSERFVSRGTYEFTNNQTATIIWQLWGSGYTFRHGDTIRVELLAQDAPFMRPAPGPFAVTVSDFAIELPAHEPPDGREIVKPVLARQDDGHGS